MDSKINNLDFINMTNNELVIFFHKNKDKIDNILLELSPKLKEYEEIKELFFSILKEIEKRNIKIEL